MGIERLARSVLELFVDKAQADKALGSFEKNVKDVQKGVEGTFPTYKQLGATVAAAFGAQAIKSFVGSIFTYAESVKDAAARTEVGIVRFQQFDKAARDGGAGAGAFEKSIQHMSNALADATEGDAVSEMLSGMGLSLRELQAMKPEDAFLKITDALKDIKNPMDQVRIAQDLFGKSGKELLPAIREGYRQAADAAEAMTEETVRELEGAKQAWEDFSNIVIIKTGNMLGAFMRDVPKAASGWRMFLGDLAATAKGSLTGGMAGAIEASAAYKRELAGQIQAEHQAAAAKDEHAKATQVVAVTQKDYAKELAAAKTTLAALTPETRRQLDAAIDLGVSNKDLAKQFGLSEKAIALYKEQAKQGAKATKDLSAELDKLSGAKTDKEIRDLAANITLLGKQGKTVAEEELPPLINQLNEWTAAGRTLPPVLEKIRTSQGLWLAGVPKAKTVVSEFFDSIKVRGGDAVDVLAEVENAIDDVVDATNAAFQIAALPSGFFDVRPDFFKTIKTGKVEVYELVDGVLTLVDASDDWRDSLGDVSQAFVAMGQSGPRALNLVTQGLGTAIAAVLGLDRGIAQINKGGFTNLLSGAAGVAGALTQLTSLAVGFGRAIHDALTVSEEEKIVKDLRKQLGLALDEADPLVKKIKQLQGRPGIGQFPQPGQGITRGQAENLVLPDLLERAGGLNSENYRAFTERTYELLGFLQRNGPRAAEALEPLNRMMGQLGDFELQQRGLFSVRLRQNIRELLSAGVELTEVTRLLNAQMERNAGAVDKLAAGFASKLAPAARQITDLQEELDGLQERDDLGADEVARVAQLKVEIAALKGEATAASQEEFDRITRLTLAMVNQYQAAGKSSVEAIRLAGPAIDQLLAQWQTFGFAGGAAFEELKRKRDLVTENAGLLEQAGAINELAASYVNLGGTNTEVLKDLEAQGMATYQSLIERGFTEREALEEMAPLLTTLRTLHKEKNFEIDEGTLKLIEQAEQAGVLKDKEDDLIDVVKALPKQIADALAESFGGVRREADKTAGYITGLFGRVRPRVTVEYDTSGAPTGAPAPEPAAPGFRWGTPDYDFMQFRREGSLIAAHGKEAIVPQGGGHQLAGEIAGALGPLLAAGGDRPIHLSFPLYFGTRKVDEIVWDSTIRTLERNDGNGAQVSPVGRALSALGLG